MSEQDSSKGTILIVEQREILREAMAAKLTEDGYNVIAVADRDNVAGVIGKQEVGCVLLPPHFTYDGHSGRGDGIDWATSIQAGEVAGINPDVGLILVHGEHYGPSGIRTVPMNLFAQDLDLETKIRSVSPEVKTAEKAAVKVTPEGKKMALRLLAMQDRVTDHILAARLQNGEPYYTQGGNRVVSVESTGDKAIPECYHMFAGDSDTGLVQKTLTIPINNVTSDERRVSADEIVVAIHEILQKEMGLEKVGDLQRPADSQYRAVDQEISTADVEAATGETRTRTGSQWFFTPRTLEQVTEHARKSLEVRTPPSAADMIRAQGGAAGDLEKVRPRGERKEPAEGETEKPVQPGISSLRDADVKLLGQTRPKDEGKGPT